MRKGTGTKERISLTLDRGIVSILKKNCNQKMMKVSNYIEKLILIGLKNEKK